MMASSMFGAKQRISEPLSALAVHTGRYREIKHPRPNFSQNSTSQRNQRVNDIGQWSNRLSYMEYLIVYDILYS